ncbi:hypothetical protein AA0229_0614 [Gluconobacter cerinus NRIC 0229]|nr:hypothetical protein AA0229_0614 [Gluconobacter cerinus NRIC 0229]
MQAGAHGYQKFQPFSGRNKGGRDDPGVFATPSCGEEDTVISQTIRRPCDLLEVWQINAAATFLRSQISAVSMSWKEPKNVDFLGDTPDGGICAHEKLAVWA